MTLVLLSGVLFGLGFIIKQYGVFFIGLGITVLLLVQMKSRPLFQARGFSQIGLFLLGAALPYAITCSAFIYTGSFDKFCFWTVEYALKYISQTGLQDAWSAFKTNAVNILEAAPLIWIMAGIGLGALFWDRSIRERRSFILLFLFYSFLSICPGFYFRPHYFILLLPVASLLAGIGIYSCSQFLFARQLQRFSSLVPLLLLIICAGSSIWIQREFLFKITPEQVSRYVYGLNPFPESRVIASYIHTNPKKRIALRC